MANHRDVRGSLKTDGTDKFICKKYTITYNIKFKKILGPWDGSRGKQLHVKLNPTLLLLKLN